MEFVEKMRDRWRVYGWGGGGRDGGRLGNRLKGSGVATYCFKHISLSSPRNLVIRVAKYSSCGGLLDSYHRLINLFDRCSNRLGESFRSRTVIIFLSVRLIFPIPLPPSDQRERERDRQRQRETKRSMSDKFQKSRVAQRYCVIFSAGVSL